MFFDSNESSFHPVSPREIFQLWVPFTLSNFETWNLSQQYRCEKSVSENCLDRIIYKCVLTEADRRLINSVMHTFLKSIVVIFIIPENIFWNRKKSSDFWYNSKHSHFLIKTMIAAGFLTLLNRKCQVVSVMSTDKQVGFKIAAKTSPVPT